MIRKYLLSLPVLAAGVVPAAHAQFAVYGTISGERLTNVKCSVTPSSACPGGGVDQTVGAEGGVYYNFMRLGPARLALDLRAGETKSNKSSAVPLAGNNAVRVDEALGGVRASFHSPVKFIEPYAQGSIGWNRRVNPQGYGSQNFLAYRVYGGLDFEVTSIMDVRVPEIGVGQNIGFNGASNNWTQSISVGVVFHTPRNR